MNTFDLPACLVYLHHKELRPSRVRFRNGVDPIVIELMTARFICLVRNYD
jgi:hypothetical protein